MIPISGLSIGLRFSLARSNQQRYAALILLPSWVVLRAPMISVTCLPLTFPFSVSLHLTTLSSCRMASNTATCDLWHVSGLHFTRARSTSSCRSLPYVWTAHLKDLELHRSLSRGESIHL
ncbi:hypothetical protein K469DRAFT_317913 [Zopfia rhizophila CBS 207.26]|uniref:Uncharacterized protein n=1 Tax=Zopfia rhizophila CBS 207.26 TaxID=1314779 RepID=A0A6A6ERM4_9PEZI|nr:hypothetical protein K469DRAFT_317913 [Zopfia rhizophila CBS 207.26]